MRAAAAVVGSSISLSGRSLLNRAIFPTSCRCVCSTSVRCAADDSDAQRVEELPHYVQRGIKRQHYGITTLKDERPVLHVWTDITPREVASLLRVEYEDVLLRALELECVPELDDAGDRGMDVEQCVRLCSYFGHRAVFSGSKRSLPLSGDVRADEARDNRDAYPRPQATAKQRERWPLAPPVVTIMGHVDHGKTTLLDALRRSSIAAGEPGGITQKIGAFEVCLPLRGERLTFIDTPGHAAFAAMRQRGTTATDLVVLVVAADDGVMPQTVESIQFAQAARVPLVVAVNKCDKYNVDVAATLNGLLPHGVHVQQLGGDVPAVPISALTGSNLDTLQLALVERAKQLDLRADPAGLVEGVVLESRVLHGLGKLATTLVRRGTLRRGAMLVAGTSAARVRAMFDETGSPVDKAGPSQPVEVSGWKDELPSAGEIVLQLPKWARVKQVINFRRQKRSEEKALEEQNFARIMKVAIDERRATDRAEYEAKRALKLDAGVTRGRLYSREYRHQEQLVVHTHDPTVPRLGVLLKADTDGAIETLLRVLESYADERVTLDIVDFGVGTVSEKDLEMASEFDAVIYSFHLGPIPDNVNRLAEQSRVQLVSFDVIYHLVDDLRMQLNNSLPVLHEEDLTGWLHFVLLHHWVLAPSTS